MNLERTFIVSDWHLNHANILRYCPNRLDLFRDVGAMTTGLVEATMRRVQAGDVLFFLGDLTFQIGRKQGEVFELLGPLREKLSEMHWIVGNHDEPGRMPEVAGLFDSVRDAWQTRLMGRHVFFSHYPLEVAHRDQLRLVSLHGHHHGSVPSPPGRIDLSVDALYGLRDYFDPGYRGEAIAIKTALALAEMDLPAPYPKTTQPSF